MFSSFLTQLGGGGAAGGKQAPFLYLPPPFLSAPTIPYLQPVGVNVVFVHVDIFIFLVSHRYQLFLVLNCYDISKFNMVIIALAAYLLHVITYTILHEEPPKICSIVPAQKSPLMLGICLVANEVGLDACNWRGLCLMTRPTSTFINTDVACYSIT